MATVLHLKKAVEEIRLDDSPDSPVYKLDLTDKEVVKNGKKVHADYLKYADVLKRVEDGSESPDDLKVMGDLFESVITTCLGKKAFSEILDYVRDGDEDIPRDDLLLLMTPVVLYLLERINDVTTANNSEAVLKYARSKSAASGAI